VGPKTVWPGAETWPAKGFSPWTVQPVTSHNADYDISAQK